MRQAVRFLLGLVLFAGSDAATAAPVNPFLLPAACADFALDPDTGTLAAVVTDHDTVLFFKADAWQSGKLVPSATLAVGPAPVVIAFKQYKDRRVFVVGCAGDASLFVCDADRGTLVRKIPLPSVGVTGVAASVNPDDPFVYYTYIERDPQSASPRLGAVSLARLGDLGVVAHSKEIAISASGEMAYQRSPGSTPSGLQSLLRTSDGATDRPAFAAWFYAGVASDPYVPDPFDRFTASGRQIFTRSLEKAVAELPFVPMCWSRARPLLVGVVADNPNRIAAAAEAKNPRWAVLRAASSNSFRPTGGTVMVDASGPLKGPLTPPDSAAGAGAAAAAERFWQLRMFVYDRGQSVIYARRDRLAVVPLAGFGGVDEPFLAARLTGGGDLLLGRESVLKLQPADPRVRVECTALPEGMRAAGDELRWQPTAAQIGPARLTVRLMHAGIEREQTFELSVRRPSVTLPFAALGCALAEDGRTAVIWDGIAMPSPGAMHDLDGPGMPRLATIDISTGAVKAERRLPDELQQAVVIGDWVLLIGAESDRCDAHDIQTLERKRMLLARGPIEGFGSCPGAIVLASPGGLDVFDAATLENRGRYASLPVLESAQAPAAAGIEVPTMLTSRGLIVRGVLLDAAGKPALILRPFVSSVLPGDQPAQLPAWCRSTIRPVTRPTQPVVGSLQESGTIHLAGAVLPPNNAVGKLEFRMQHRMLSDASRVPRWDYDLVATMTGDRPLNAILDRQRDLPSSPLTTAPIRAALWVTQDALVATFRDRLHHVPLPAAAGGEQAGPPLLTPRQSALVLSPEGPTTLAHMALGGRPPLTFSLVGLPEGMAIDAATGTVTVDREAVVEAAARVIEKTLVAQPADRPAVAEFRRVVEVTGREVAEIIGRRTTGLPVLLPVHVAVTDADGAKDSLRYHVVAEIPEPRLLPRLQQFDELRRLKAAQDAFPQPATAPFPPRLPQPATPQPGRMPADDEKLVRRIEALEQRIALVLRQINEIRKRLDP
jgi:hypothetical protein